jgi:hypothetical protein
MGVNYFIYTENLVSHLAKRTFQAYISYTTKKDARILFLLAVNLGCYTVFLDNSV